MSSNGKRQIDSVEVRALFKRAKPSSMDSGARSGVEGGRCLCGLRVLILENAGIGNGRAKLLANVASSLGAKSGTKLKDIGGGAGDPLVVVVVHSFSQDKLRERLSELNLETNSLTIVSDIWISTCKEQHAKVPFEGYQRNIGPERVAEGPIQQALLQQMPSSMQPPQCVRLGDVEVDAIGFGTMNLGTFSFSVVKRNTVDRSFILTLLRNYS